MATLDEATIGAPTQAAAAVDRPASLVEFNENLLLAGLTEL